MLDIYMMLFEVLLLLSSSSVENEDKQHMFPDPSLDSYVLPMNYQSNLLRIPCANLKYLNFGMQGKDVSLDRF